MRRHSLVLLVLFFVPAFLLRAQTENQQLTAFLKKRGFDHLVIRSNRQSAGIAYENYGYRNEVLAAKIVAAGAALTFPDQRLYMVPHYCGVPMVVLQNDQARMGTFAVGQDTIEIPRFRVASLTVQQQWEKSAIKPKFHPRLEIILHPEIKALFGNYNDPLRTQLNLLPEFRFSLLRGVHVSSHLVIPMYDDIGHSVVRPGPTWLTHLMKWKQSFFFYTAGLLQNERYGIQFGTHSFIHSAFALSARLGYSGAAAWAHDKMNIYPIEQWTYNLKLVYFNPSYQFFASLGYHQFLDGMNGWRFDFYRYFHELRMGFWGMAVQGEMNGGFHVSIALPPFKYKSTKRIRVRPANYFRWEYRAAALNSMGRTLKANIYLDDQFDRYTPAYLNARL